MRVFITGDKHGDFRSIEHFVKNYDTTLEDYLIILGDAGVNYYNNTEDYYRKKKLSELPINIIFIHGNHEIRPQNIPTYKWHLIENELGGVFYQEDDFPNLLFAHRGVFWLGGKRFLVCDGAYSIDKFFRLDLGQPWWPDEQMNDDDKDFIRSCISFCPKFDFVLSHAAPLSHEPTHLFLRGFNFIVDDSTPRFLEEVYNSINQDYLTQWYFGHYHGDEKLPDKFTILFNSFVQVV